MGTSTAHADSPQYRSNSLVLREKEEKREKTIRAKKIIPMGYNDPSKPSEGNSAYPSAPPPAYQPYEETPEPSSGLINSAGFEDLNVRRFFIRKVYAVLTLQLAFTAGIIALFNGSDAVKEALGADGSNNGRAAAVLYSSYGLFVFFYFCLVCPCCNFQRKYPLNVIFLVLLTVAMSFMTGVITCYYDTKAVLLAAATTASVVAFVTCMTFYSKFDITKFWYIIILSPFVSLIMWFVAFLTGSPAMIAVYCGVGVVIFTIYLAYDTKMIMGGGRIELSPDDWIFAVVQLYVAIVQIFLYLLQLFGRSD